MKKLIILLMTVSLGFNSCKKEDNGGPSDQETLPKTATPAFMNVSISTDKAAYKPGEEVIFTIDASKVPSSAKLRYKHLNTLLAENPFSASGWKWTTPGDDFKAYMVEVYGVENNVETIYATIGIDVSSDWKKFPRYGFLSNSGNLSNAEIENVMNNLNRHHINGIQFYDWMNKHHKPLPMNGASPASNWKDIMNRDMYFSTIERYIASAHAKNMKAMFYNLVYGAWKDAESEGVDKEWFVYTNASHTNKDYHPLPTPPFLSNIYLLDPSNAEWQEYIINEHKKVYQFLAFDGFHMDQLGDRGARYKYDGTSLNLAMTFKPFINAVKAKDPQKYVVMNAVNQYGQKEIAASGADFLYTEVWNPYETYFDLASLIKQNNTYSNNTKNTVLAAYMNYDLANSQGYFNTSSVLMTDAVIFAFGGAHLELGEHMLGKEYFPNNNLSMKGDLKKALVSYYDFLVAYQNLLRDGGTFNTVALSSENSSIPVAEWPASNGSIAKFGKKVGNRQVLHLINFRNSKTDKWRDNAGVQVLPTTVKDLKLVFTAEAKVKSIWIASPDFAGGASRKINFSQAGNKVNFTVPELLYWDMLVVEYE